MKRGFLGRGIVSLAVWLLLLTCLSVPAHAQGTTPASGAAPTLASLDVGVWPEYDRPEVLVIYRGEFAPDVVLPLAVEWRIPADAGAPSAVAAVDPQQGLVNQPNTTRVEGDWLVISFELSTPGFQVEYYAPYGVSGDRRSFVFTYPGDYAVTTLALEALVPRSARDFVLDPAAASVSEDTNGLTYHQAEAGPLAQGESKSWTVSYVKTDSGLSAVTPVPAAAATAAPAAGSTGDADSTVWIFLIAFIALVGVGAGAFWLGRRAFGSSAPEGVESGERYCHVCGAAVPADARYCPKCAAPVRER